MTEESKHLDRVSKGQIAYLQSRMKHLHEQINTELDKITKDPNFEISPHEDSDILVDIRGKLDEIKTAVHAISHIRYHCATECHYE